MQQGPDGQRRTLVSRFRTDPRYSFETLIGLLIVATLAGSLGYMLWRSISP